MRFGLIALILTALPNGWSANLATRPELSYTKAIGGSGSDTGVAVATDTSGNVYVAGNTNSLDFPLVNPVQRRIGGARFRASTDGGKTWTTPGIPDPVYAVAASPKAPAIVFAGTARAIYKSIDSGKTWSVLPAAGTSVVSALWVDPDTPSVIHAATSRGMLKSTDAGLTWRTGVTGNALAMAAHPTKPSQLFAAMDFGGIPNRPSLYRSIDGGATWTLLANSPLGPIMLACDAAKADVVYAGVSSSGFNSSGTTSLYRSIDAGATWTKVSQPRLAISTFAIASGPTGLFAATRDGLWRSTDGGESWKPTTLTYPADDVTIDPTRGQTIYANATAGLFASTDGGATWVSILPVRQLVETLAVAPTVPPTVFVGADFGRNVFVTKWSADGKQMLYSTYLGGSYLDYATGLAVDRQGNAYVTGYAYSTDFPVTANAIQAKNAGNYNAFLAKIGPGGDKLEYSTYLGGSTADAAFGIALDASANVYLTGYARSPDFPVTADALQTKLRQDCTSFSTNPTPPLPGDAFVAKLATDGSGLRYATFLGGGCYDEGIGIAVDAIGSAYVAGATTSEDFPVTIGTLLPTYSGGSVTGFLAKISPGGNLMGYATYLGGARSDSAFAVAVDAKGAAYVTGSTWGFDEPVYVPNPILTTTANLNFLPVGFATSLGGAAFVAKIDSTGSTRQYLKYLGGTWGMGTGIWLDSSGNAWITGRTFANASTETFPTVHPFQAGDGGGFVSEVAPDGSLLFSSLTESAQQIAVDVAGNAFVVGSTISNTSKTGTSALLLRMDGAVSNAIALEAPQRITKAISPFTGVGVAAGEIVSLTGIGLGPAERTGAKIGPDGKLATLLAGTTVKFDGVPAPLLSVQSQEIVCFVPFGVARSGSTTVQAQSNGSASNAILFPTSSSSIEMLTAVNADWSINSSGRPAAPGSVVTLYGAGFGQTNPAGGDGVINGTGASTFNRGTIGVKVGDQDAQLLYAGPAPGEVAGIVQINFRVPQLPPGSYSALAGWSPVKQGDYDGLTIWVGQP